jgi:putative secretion ATPase (PEP-CTERM system associated)
MYEAHYGLRAKPFQLNPDPGFYFDSKQHRSAKAYLTYGVSVNQGFIVITGEVGAGKTTVLRSLLDNLQRDDLVIGQVVTTQLDAEDTLRMVGAAFGVRVQGVSKSEVLIQLEAFFTQQAAEGRRCLLIVDEAQNLTPRAVEELRMISNYQLGTQSLLQTFLVGQPEFRDVLRRPEMEQFRQRVVAGCHLGPLDGTDTEAYITHRLKTAGATDRPSFEDGALAAIHQVSLGIPRRVNLLCDRLLLLGFLRDRTHLTVADVHEVATEMASETGTSAVRPLSAVGVAHKERTGDVHPADELDQQLRKLALEQHADRLARLERSMLRIERMNLELLVLLRQLVQGTRRDPGAEEGSG